MVLSQTGHLSPYQKAVFVALTGGATLWFGCDRSEFSQYVGMIFSATIAGHATNENIQAATVILPAGIPFHHDRPYITLSHSEGTLPMESTQMLKDCEIESVATIATFRIEFFQFL